MKKDYIDFAYQELVYADPLLIANYFADFNGFILFHSGMLHDDYGQYSFILFNPLETFTSHEYLDFNQDLIRLQDILQQNSVVTQIDHFIGGIAGYLSYDLGVILSGNFATKAYSSSDLSNKFDQVPPLYRLGLYNKVITFDHKSKKCYASVVKFKSYNYSVHQEIISVVNLYNQAQNFSAKNEVSKTNFTPLKLSSNITYANYITKVEQARNYIKHGDIFEVNLSQKFSSIVDKNYELWSIYNNICRYNPTQFSCYLNYGDLQIASASPERFLKINNQHIETRPIKGTIKQLADSNLDQKNIDILLNSEKDIAENIMIVDLMRNDLSKVCKDDSVIVTKLCGLETFPGVHHLVSVVEGDLLEKYDQIDAFLACFPGGSITGAPKIRAMEIIDELEPHSRGVYCGNIGYWGLNAISDFSIAIRTIVKYNSELSFCVGGAITLHSDAENEYQETLSKGERLADILTNNPKQQYAKVDKS